MWTRVLAVALAFGLSASTVVAEGLWGKSYFSNLEVVDQDGRKLRFYGDGLKGNQVVISFIYTTCKEICPLNTSRLARVKDIVGKRDGLTFISISVDPENDTPEKLKAIRYAVEDIDDATGFIIKNHASLKIDTNKLILSGSSAGAEAVLNYVYDPFVHRKSFRQHSYKAVMSFAGAVLDLNMLTAQTWIPVFMMHGTNDQLVPYGTSPHRFCKASDAGWLMMFGAETIYNKGVELNKPVVLYGYEGAGHEVSNYMFRKFTVMDEFIKNGINGSSFYPQFIQAE